MSKIPIGSPPEVQQSFREVWEAINPFLRTNIDLSGRRIINAGPAKSGSDYVTQQQVSSTVGFDAFYDELKKRGLDGFRGRLADPQEAVAAEYPDPPPTTHAIGQIYYDPVASQLKIVTEAGVVIITSGSLIAESGSGNIVRLDGTGTLSGNRTVSGTWTFSAITEFQSHIDINGLYYIWPSSHAAGVLTNAGGGNLSWAAGGGGTLDSLTDTALSGLADHDSFYYDSASGDWKNTAAVQINDAGALTITGSTTGRICTVWTTATNGDAHFALKNDVQEWRISILGSLSDRLVIQNTTGGTNIIAITSTGTFYPITSGTPSLGGSGNRWANLYLKEVLSVSGGSNSVPIAVSSSAASVLCAVTSTYTNGQAGFTLTNDARSWVFFVDSADRFAIRDNTAGLHRLYIDLSGVCTINGTMELTDTQPRITFTDTTASAHAAYLQMDSNILQINVNGVSIMACGDAYTNLYKDAGIAGSGYNLGFFSATKVAKQTVTGSKGANAALASLLTALANYGLVTDSST